MSPQQWREQPKADQIAIIADANLRARATQKASKGRKPRPRYNATESGADFWTG